MKLLLEQEGTEAQRLRMLDQKSGGALLDEIHFRENASWQHSLDSLRHSPPRSSMESDIEASATRGTGTFQTDPSILRRNWDEDPRQSSI